MSSSSTATLTRREPVQTAPGRMETVLVVDDMEDLRETLADVCSAEGYQVATACNGLEAIDLIEGGCEPSLIVLDLMMPVMNGFEFLGWLTENEARIGHIPVVVVSGDAREYVRVVMAYRPAGLLAKPIALDQLLHSVAVHCTASGRQGCRHLL